MNFRVAVLIIVSLPFLSTCTSDVYNPDVNFQENILPIFVSKCSTTGCHNSIDREADYDLSNYEGIMQGVVPKHPLLSEVYTVIDGKNPSMPVGGKLSRKEVSYIKIWIKMGAKNTTVVSSCDTIVFTFNAVIQPLINTWCVGCHSASNPGGGYDLSSYSGIKTSITKGRLLGTFKHDPGFSAMPKGSGKLSDCDITKVEKWIKSGYPNN